MEYFNQITSEYKRTIESGNCFYKIRLELLTYYESTIGEITKDVSDENTGQININYNQLTRRSCNLTLANIDPKYNPASDNEFWQNRKFKLWIGVVSSNWNVYWWSMGIFIAKDVSGNFATVQINAVDKGGLLDGTLKTNVTESQYIIRIHSNVLQIIRDTLSINPNETSELSVYQGGWTNYLVDPIPPLVDVSFRDTWTESEISIDSGVPLGNLFTLLAENYEADVYYNQNGNLRFEPLIAGNRIGGYMYLGSLWDFSTDKPIYSNSELTCNFDGENTVTVYTNASNLENVSYTAYNNNPISPLRTAVAGIRRMASQEITYVDTTKEDMLVRCKQYADYLLIKNSMQGMTVNFNSPIIPHLDVNKTITITDEFYKFNRDKFVIQSLSIPLSANAMKITATNVSWLPNTINIEGRR